MTATIAAPTSSMTIAMGTTKRRVADTPFSSRTVVAPLAIAPDF